MVSSTTGEFEQAAQALNSAWESGVVVDFAAVIPAEAQSDTDLLVDLACIDFKHRIRHDQETRVETYTARFPQLGEDELVLLELIRTEYYSRPDRESLDAASYGERFPNLARQIELMFQLETERSDSAAAHRAPEEWRCSACLSPIKNRDSGATACDQCGQPVAIGRYELLDRAGQGAFGYVYRARDPKLDRQVALKVPRASRFLTPEEVERFLRESRSAAQLDHPGIVRVFDAGRQDSVPYIVSEFIEGQSLAEWMANRHFDFRESASLVAKIANAVAHAHQRGVIHRDLKPSNVLVVRSEDGWEPRVMDFGLARRIQSDTTVTLDGQTVGTPAYMSPEQAQGHQEDVGPRSDVYSLGVILYQLVCGELPFRGNVQSILQQVIGDDPPPPSRFRDRIPRDLETICLKAINREPQGRYASVAALESDLNHWLSGKPIQARPIGPLGRSWRWCQRRPTVAALLAALVVAITIGMTGIAYQWRQAEIAKKASEADLRDALESVDRVLGHLGSDTLVDIPQAKQLRAAVLNDALEFFERFRQRNPDDPRVAMQVAQAHYQVARIQSALGNTESALHAYQDAVSDFDSLESRAPEREAWLEAASSAHSAFAGLLYRRSQRQQAQEHQQRCLELRQSLVAEFPERGIHQAKYATAQADLGRMLTRPEDIAAAFEAAIDRLESLVESREAIGYKQDLARVLNNYAIHLSRRGEKGRAEEYRQRAVELLELVVADDPGDESKLALYANTCLQLVKSLRLQSRPGDALLYQDKALAAYRQLTEDFPATPRHRVRFASVLNEIGDHAVVQDRFEDAVTAYAEAVRQWETLVALFPANRSYQLDLAAELDPLAESLITVGQKPQAESRFRQRLAIRRETAGGAVRDTIELVTAINELASLLSNSSSPKKAEESKQLRDEADSLMKGIGVDEVMETEVSNSRKLGLLNGLIRLAKQNEDLESQERCYRAKIRIYEEGLAEDPNRLSRKSGLAKQWASLGLTLRDLDRDQESIEAYEQAVKLDEQLLSADPGSETYATLMMSHSSSLTLALTHHGDPSEAARVIRRALELARRLYEERKNEAFRQTRVVMAYLQLGDALAAEGQDFAGALAAYNEAVSMADILREQPVFERYEATVLNSAAWLLVTCPDESLRDPDRALELSRRAVDISPQDGSCVNTLAFALYQTGQYEESIQRFEKSSQLDEELVALNTLMIALAEAKSGNMERADETYRRALALRESHEAEPEQFESYRQQAEAILYGK